MEDKAERGQVAVGSRQTGRVIGGAKKGRKNVLKVLSVGVHEASGSLHHPSSASEQK